jgi:fatty acid desaturase
MESVAAFSGSIPGQMLLAIGQMVVVVCVCFDMVRALSVPRSHRRYLASTVFRTLAIPSIIVNGLTVLIALVLWSWIDVVMGMFVLVAIIFRLHHDKDEDNWWKGKGKKLARWARRQLAGRTSTAPAMG